jgi:hypothetical protein
MQQSKTTVSVVELELLILPEHMSLLTVLGGVRVGRYLVFLQQTEHTRGHLWRRYSLMFNKVTMATITLSKYMVTSF